MSTEPKVTVIIPSCDRSHMITRAIDSVANQSYHDWEAIIVENSTDAVHRAKVHQIAGRYGDKMRVVDAGQAIGTARANNIGVAEAKGEMICPLADDDAFVPRSLEICIDAWEHRTPTDGLVYGDYLETTDWVNFGLIRSGPYDRARLKREAYISCLVMSPRETIERVGGYESIDGQKEDWIFSLKATKFYTPIYVRVPLYIVYTHGTNQKFKDAAARSSRIELERRIERGDFD